ncbi:unnamed protein product, partial [Symbiodinium necroappetens]
DPPKNFCVADNKYLQKVVKELGPDLHESLVHMVSYCSARLSAKKEHVILDFRPVLNTVLARQSEFISGLLDCCDGERLGKRAPGALVRKVQFGGWAHLYSSRPVRSGVAAMAAWTVLDPTKEARAVLDEMAKSLLDDPSMPAPAQLQSPPAEVLRTLMAGNAAGQAIGKGNSSEVHACQSDPRFVIRTVRQQDEVEWQRELSRLKRVPALSVITTIFATSGRRSLMPRLWPGEASEGTQGTGSWEKSAISARRFSLAGLLQPGWLPRTVESPSSPPASSDPTESWTTDKSLDGGLAHSSTQSVLPVPATVNEVRLPGIWGDRQEASTTGIPDSGAIPSQASLPGVQATFSSPVQSAIRHAAANLSAAISFAQDMEQSMPLQTQSTLAESLRVTSDILREVSEELIAVAKRHRARRLRLMTKP